MESLLFSMEKLVIFNLSDGIYETKLTKKFLERKPYKKEESGIVKACIPGKITKIYVKEGTLIEKNIPLLVLEAMKMQNEIFSPLKGVIEKIYVKEKSVVVKNQILIKIKEK